MKNLGLYLHMPFCKNKCAYCDFYSITDQSYVKRYSKAIRLQLEDYSSAAEEYEIDSVFIGGGTPSIMPTKYLNDIINSIYDNFNVLDDAEFTIEVNPATVDYHTLKHYKKYGINRLSIGMQSSKDSELKALGRIHDYDDFENCFEEARRAGFDNINVDVMYGIPGQTIDSFKDTLDFLIELHPDHISLYGLMLEEGTPLYNQVQNGEVKLPDEDVEYEMYCMAIEILRNNGYDQYEISNFAQPGFECKHNLKYWNCEEYIGFGPAAHSYFQNHRYSFKKDIKLFIDSLESIDGSGEVIDENYEIRPNERKSEYIMLQLRLKSGLDVDKYESIFNESFEEKYSNCLKEYIKHGFMQKIGNNYSFTTKGMYVSNYILSAMLDFDSNITANIANGSDK